MVAEPWATYGRLVPPVVMPLRVVVAKGLHAFTQQAADDRALERLMMIDGRPGNRSDHGAAGLAVVVTICLGAIVTVVMMGLRKRASGRQEEREAQQCCLDLSVDHEVCLRPLSIA